MVLLVADTRAQWAELDRRIAAFDAEFVRWVKENEDGSATRHDPRVRRDRRIRPCRRSRASGEPLIEVVIFRPGLASSLGSSPPAANRSCSASASAATNTLRRQLIHGARAAMPYVAERDTPLGPMGEGTP